MRRSGTIGIAIFVTLIGILPAHAAGLLDGRAFSGMIGPADDPDLPDTLYFDDGHFWSQICTRCGFVPGRYASERTEVGVTFSGVLKSEERGTFEYAGVAYDDGRLEVSIKWEKRRWYWTLHRDIAFRGTRIADDQPPSLENILLDMAGIDPDANPLCARF